MEYEMDDCNDNEYLFYFSPTMLQDSDYEKKGSYEYVKWVLSVYIKNYNLDEKKNIGFISSFEIMSKLMIDLIEGYVQSSENIIEVEPYI